MLSVLSFWPSYRSYQAWQRRLKEDFGFIIEVWGFRALVDRSLWGLIPFVDVFLFDFIGFILPFISTIGSECFWCPSEVLRVLSGLGRC
jgi:hypothetical protein